MRHALRVAAVALATLPQIAVAQPGYQHDSSESYLPPPQPTVTWESTKLPAPVRRTARATKSATRPAGHAFPWGQCTWLVASKRTVTWRGNASAWLRNAAAQGYATSKTPSVGAIGVTAEGRYGHVVYVTAVDAAAGTFTFTEANYHGLGLISTRTLKTDARVVRGFIL